MRSARAFAEQRFPMKPHDRHFNPLPLTGLGALQPLNGCLAVGAAFIGMEHFEPAEALALLAEERCTVAFPAIDRIWASILDQPAFAEADISPLWLVAVDGDPDLLRATAEQTPAATQLCVYGSTEAGGLIALSHLDDPLELRISSAGRPFHGIELKILDPEHPARSSPRASRDRSPCAAGRCSRATTRTRRRWMPTATCCRAISARWTRPGGCFLVKSVRVPAS